MSYLHEARFRCPHCSWLIAISRALPHDIEQVKTEAERHLLSHLTALPRPGVDVEVLPHKR